MSKPTDKLIDDIIELILGDMNCYHDPDYEYHLHRVCVEYSLNDEMKIRRQLRELIKKAKEQIKKMIQKPEITEEWKEKKATRLYKKAMFTPERGGKSTLISMAWAMDFINSLVEEIECVN